MKSDFAKLASFTLTLFTSALLLFLVQPMVGKLILPLLGGTPAVWNTCMVFFQALLLAGYSYAHFSTRYFGVKKQSFYHLILMMVPFLFVFPITIREEFLADTESLLIPRLLLVLFLSAGIPFFVVSASAPLLQRWFSKTGHPSAQDPYFLYAASNLGSMIALVGYPAFIEPYLTLQQQRWGWGIGYGLLVTLTALCVWLLRQSPELEEEAHDFEVAAASSEKLPFTRVVRWVLLGAVPSSLMLGATTYMTTDIAAIPLLWVAPLGIYLLSFIIVFARVPDWVHFSMVLMMPLGVLLLLFLMLSGLKPLDNLLYLIGIHLAVLFLVSMVCHGELAKDRPSPENLTAFYLWMSLGGVVGGLFNGLFAPLVFPVIAEYQVALVVACVMLPPLGKVIDTPWTRLADLLLSLSGLLAAIVFITLKSWDRSLGGQPVTATWLLAILLGMAVVWAVYQWAKGELSPTGVFDLVLPATFGLLATGLALGIHSDAIFPKVRVFLEQNNLYPGGIWVLIYGIPCILCYTLVDRPMRFALGLTAVIIAYSFNGLFDKDIIWQSRGFFGALKIERAVEHRSMNVIKLLHGTTLHGMQPEDQDRLFIPMTYYSWTGPIGHVMENYNVFNKEGRFPPIAVIGLGTGTLSVYGHSNQVIDFYDIDPLVKSISFDPNAIFKYTEFARQVRGSDVHLYLGDARVMLKNPKKGTVDKYGIIAVDAFSSDAIPVHLLTKESMAIYLDRLADDGVVVFHTSNRYLRLEPVLANMAKSMDLAILGFSDSEENFIGKSASTWVAVARKPEHLAKLMSPQSYKEKTETVKAYAEAMMAIPYAPASQLGFIIGTAAEKWVPCWIEPATDDKVGVWTDDYSNILGVFTTFRISSILLWMVAALVFTALLKGIFLWPLVPTGGENPNDSNQTLVGLIGDSLTSFLLMVGITILVAVPAAILSEAGIFARVHPMLPKILVGLVFASLDFLVQLGILGQSCKVRPHKARTLAFVGLVIDALPILAILWLTQGAAAATVIHQED